MTLQFSPHAKTMDIDETQLHRYPSDTDLDFSFTSTATDRTFASSSARSSLARSSLTLSFNDRLSTTSTTTTTIATPTTTITNSLHLRKCDPHWSAIKTATNLSTDGKLHLRHFKLLRHLGTGNLGRVFLCQLRDCNNANFALKVIDKDSLTKKKLSQVQMEGEILSMLDHPFLPTLYTHLEVSHYSCLLIDYCPNGDLHSLLRKQPGNRLPVQAVKFFAAELLVALEYLHALGVVYRDLKPENILLREDGHIMLSDFDLCFKADVVPTFDRRVHRKRMVWSMRNGGSCFGTVNRRGVMEEEMVEEEFVAEPTAALSRSCVGTHEYLAPELLSGNGHGNGVDWWAFGVLVYELLYGTTPFKGGSKESTLRNIASSKPVTFRVMEGEGKGIEEAKDLIEKLLVKDPRQRLGCTKGATDIKRHPFFDGIKWPLIRNYKPPEVRGLVAKKGKRHPSGHVLGGVSSPKRRCWWRLWKKRGGGVLANMLRNKGSSPRYYPLNHSQQYNGNYHRYKVRKCAQL